MKGLRSLSVVTLTMGLFLAGATAKADTLSFTLSAPFQSTAPVGAVTFDATVNNNTGQTVYLNGDNASLDAPLDLSDLSDADYDNDFPLFLDPGESVTDSLFTVTVPLGIPSGTYAGSFEITGGSTGSDQLVLGTAAFDVEVTGGGVVPEPSSLVLVVTGLAGIGEVLRRRLIRGVRA